MSFRTLQNNNDAFVNDTIYIVYIKKKVIPVDDTIPLNFDAPERYIKGVYNYRPTFFEQSEDFEIVGPFQVQKKMSMLAPSAPPRRLPTMQSPQVAEYHSDIKFH